MIIAIWCFRTHDERHIQIASVLAAVLTILATVFLPSTVNQTINANVVNIYEGKVEAIEEKPTTPPQESDYTAVKVTVRNKSNELQKSSWFGTVVADEGDILQFKVSYSNKSGAVQNDVQVLVLWSDYLEYSPGTTILYNSNHKNGIALSSDGLADKGINIGNYGDGSSGVVTFECRVKDGLGIGTNVLRNWVQIYVNDLNPELVQDCVQDHADVMVMKESV